MLTKQRKLNDARLRTADRKRYEPIEACECCGRSSGWVPLEDRIVVRKWYKKWEAEHKISDKLWKELMEVDEWIWALQRLRDLV